MTLIQQSTAVIPIRFRLVTALDNLTALLGATPTVTISKNGGAFAAPSGAVSEIGNGFYKLAPNATDSNTLGPIDLKATATLANPTYLVDVAQIVAYNPWDSVRLGLTALPNAAAGANTGLPVVGTQVPNAVAGAAGGVFIAGTNAATSVPSFTINSVGMVSQTGDSYVRLGANGAGLTALGDTRMANLDVAVSTRSTYAGGSVTLTGDFSAAMKTSLGVAVAASTVSGITGVTFPAIVASPTNITAGTMTAVGSVTVVGSVAGTVGGVSGVTFPTIVASPDINSVGSLTNAATAGDLTQAMKDSIAACMAATMAPWTTLLTSPDPTFRRVLS